MSDASKHIGHDITFGKGGPGGRCSTCHEDMTKEQGDAVIAADKANDMPAVGHLCRLTHAGVRFMNAEQVSTRGPRDAARVTHQMVWRVAGLTDADVALVCINEDAPLYGFLLTYWQFETYCEAVAGEPAGGLVVVP